MANYKKKAQIKGSAQPISIVKYGYKVAYNGGSAPATYTLTSALEAADVIGDVVAETSYYYRNATITAITYGFTGTTANPTDTGLASAVATATITVSGFDTAQSASYWKSNQRLVVNSDLAAFLLAGGNDYTLSVSDNHFTVTWDADHGLILASDYNASGNITVTIAPKSGAHFTSGSFAVTVANLTLAAPTITIV